MAALGRGAGAVHIHALAGHGIHHGTHHGIIHITLMDGDGILSGVLDTGIIRTIILTIITGGVVRLAATAIMVAVRLAAQVEYTMAIMEMAAAHLCLVVVLPE